MARAARDSGGIRALCATDHAPTVAALLLAASAHISIPKPHGPRCTQGGAQVGAIVEWPGKYQLQGPAALADMPGLRGQTAILEPGNRACGICRHCKGPDLHIAAAQPPGWRQLRRVLPRSGSGSRRHDPVENCLFDTDNPARGVTRRAGHGRNAGHVACGNAGRYLRCGGGRRHPRGTLAGSGDGSLGRRGGLRGHGRAAGFGCLWRGGSGRHRLRGSAWGSGRRGCHGRWRWGGRRCRHAGGQPANRLAIRPQAWHPAGLSVHGSPRKGAAAAVNILGFGKARRRGLGRNACRLRLNAGWQADRHQRHKKKPAASGRRKAGCHSFTPKVNLWQGAPLPGAGKDPIVTLMQPAMAPGRAVCQRVP